MLLQVTLDLSQQAEVNQLAGSQTTFGGFVSTLLGGAMAIAAILVLLYLVWGAIEWITAGGESGKVQKARDRMVQAVIGILVLGSTWALFMMLQQFLGIRVLDRSMEDKLDLIYDHKPKPGQLENNGWLPGQKSP